MWKDKMGSKIPLYNERTSALIKTIEVKKSKSVEHTHTQAQAYAYIHSHKNTPVECQKCRQWGCVYFTHAASCRCCTASLWVFRNLDSEFLLVAWKSFFFRPAPKKNAASYNIHAYTETSVRFATVALFIFSFSLFFSLDFHSHVSLTFTIKRARGKKTHLRKVRKANGRN